MVAYRQGDDLWSPAGWGLTARTLGSAPGQMLGSEYGRTLLFTLLYYGLQLPWAGVWSEPLGVQVLSRNRCLSFEGDSNSRYILLDCTLSLVLGGFGQWAGLAGRAAEFRFSLKSSLSTQSVCHTLQWSPVLIGDICVPPTVNYLQYLVTGSTLTAVGPF